MKRSTLRLKHLFFLAIISLAMSCGSEPVDPPVDPKDDLVDFPYDPQAYELEYPDWLGTMAIPADNPMTEAGVELGRKLFFDPILSLDSTMSCGSCHNPSLAFQDNLALSPGVDGLLGKRSAMALVNIGFVDHGLNWDGSAVTLEQQALEPVTNEVELHETWPNVVSKLKRHDDYPKAFRAAFGINDRDEITKELAAKAIAQFERTMISYNSRYDQIKFGTGVFYEEDESRGRDLFFFELAPTLDHPGCSHCHGGLQFAEPNYFNNGLTEAATLEDFPDKGLGDVTNQPTDNGKFRAPTLRNIALTAPYMHDGRFATLGEVLDHYKTGGLPSPNVNSNIQPFTLSEQDKADLIAFLNTLTDTTFINNPAFQPPG